MSQDPGSLIPSSNQLGELRTSDDLLICTACGTQYDSTGDLYNCRICDDPRQFVPASGQKFTTLKKLRTDGHKLVFKQDEDDDRIWSITIEPKIGIGQRAILIQTPHGNVLWDLVCFLDKDAIEKINSLGGLRLIVISHPHFFTTWSDWATSFNVPVFLAKADAEWVNRSAEGSQIGWVRDRHTTLLPGITAIIAGGHFPGSMILHTASPNTKVPTLFHADTIMTVMDAHTPDSGRPGHISYTFMWSVPNMIPLGPEQVLQIWRAVKGFDVKATYGFTTVRYRKGDTKTIPERLLDSAWVFVKSIGHEGHAIFSETV